MPQKSQNNNSDALLPKLTLCLAKIAEVIHWCLAAVMLVGAVLAITQPAPFVELVKNAVSQNGVNLSCYGFEIVATNPSGEPRFNMLLIFTLGSFIILSLMAMIFRNIYLILKTTQGKTWFAKGETPFQQNIVRMFREIGIFFIATSAMSLISEIIVNITGGELISGFNYLNCFIGLVFLCVSQFFNYGTRLEKDLDGLV